MAQQSIDFGSFPNDPSADPIRAAFQKVQNNFNELYSAKLTTGVAQVQPGPGLTTNRITGNVTITANIPNVTIQTSSSLQVGLGIPSGNTATIYSYATPFVLGLANTISTVNANFSGNVTVSNLHVGNFVSGPLIPYANLTYDLGSPAHRWKDLYLSGNTMYVGTQIISTDANGIVTSGNITVNGNLNAGAVDATQVTASSGNLGGLTVTGNVTTGNISVQGDMAANSLSANVMTVTVMQATTITGNVVVPDGGTIHAPGEDTQLLFNSGGNTAGATGVTFNQTSGVLSIVGNVSGGNITSAGGLSVTRTASVGNLNSSGNVFANSGTVQSNSVISLGIISASQSITGGSIISQGILTVQGDASIGNITTVNTITGNVMTLNGNVDGVALVANGILNVSGLANLGGGLVTSSGVTASTLTVNNTISGNTISLTASLTSNTLTVNNAITANSLTVSTSLTANSYVANVGISTANITANGNTVLSGNANLTGANTNITGFLRISDANTANINASGILNVFGTGSSSIKMNNGNLTSSGTTFSQHANVSGDVYANSGTVFGQHANVSGNVYANTGTVHAIDSALTGNLYANAGQIFSNIVTANSNIYANNGTTFSQHSNVSGNVYANSGTLFGKHSNVSGNIYANTGTMFGLHANVSGNLYATTGTMFSNHANVSGNVYANTGTVFGQHANVSGNIYANTGTAFSQHANVSGNVYANSGNVFANTLVSLNNLTANVHITATNGNIYANLGTTFSNHANVSGNVYANSGTVYGNIVNSLSNIVSANHITSTTGNIYATSGTTFSQHANVTGNIYANTGTMYGQHANVTGNMYANTGTVFSNIANIANHINAGGNIYASTGTVFGQHANVSGNVYATTGTVYSQHANVSGNVYANSGTIFGQGGAITGNHGVSGIVFSGGDHTAGANLAITAASGTGTVVTLTYAQQTYIPFTTGQTITVTNMAPSGYNNTYTVVTANATAVTFNGSASGAMTSGAGVGRVIGAANLAATGTITASGNISGNTLIGSLFSGNGALLTNLTGSSITGVVGNASQITGATQANITSLPNVSSFGTKISLDTLVGNLVSANISANHYGNGYYLSSVNAANVTGKVGTATLADGVVSVPWANIPDRPSNVGFFTNASADGVTNPFFKTVSSFNTSMASYYTKTDIDNKAFVTGTPWTTAGYITGITSAMVTTALGFTPPSNGTANVSALQVGAISGTYASTGQIRATDNITAYAASDAKWKTNVRPIPNALQKAVAIGGKLFDWTDEYIAKNGGEDGYFVRKEDFGIVAQDAIAAGFSEVTRTRPDGTLAVDYEKLSALALQAVAELYLEVQKLKGN